MPGRCTICAHKDRNAIDKAIVGGGGSERQVAKRFSVSAAALHRHKTNHLSPALVQAHALQEVERGDGLLQQMDQLTSRTLCVLVAAEKKKDLRAALAAIIQVRANMELHARLLSAAHRQVTEIGVSGQRASEAKPIDLSGLTRAQFFALGWLHALVAGDPPPEARTEAERRALDGLLDEAEAWTSGDPPGRTAGHTPLSALGQGDARGD